MIGAGMYSYENCKDTKIEIICNIPLCFYVI